MQSMRTSSEALFIVIPADIFQYITLDRIRAKYFTFIYHVQFIGRQKEERIQGRNYTPKIKGVHLNYHR